MASIAKGNDSQEPLHSITAKLVKFSDAISSRPRNSTILMGHVALQSVTLVRRWLDYEVNSRL